MGECPAPSLRLVAWNASLHLSLFSAFFYALFVFRARDSARKWQSNVEDTIGKAVEAVLESGGAAGRRLLRRLREEVEADAERGEKERDASNKKVLVEAAIPCCVAVLCAAVSFGMLREEERWEAGQVGKRAGVLFGCLAVVDLAIFYGVGARYSPSVPSDILGIYAHEIDSAVRRAREKT